MPPRLPLIPRLRPQSGSSTIVLSSTSTHQSPPSSLITPTIFTLPYRLASTVAQKRRHQDPYAAAQARARKAANLSRQSVLQAARAKEHGDAVRGVTRTPLIEAFKSGTPLAPQEHPSVQSSSEPIAATSGGSRADTISSIAYATTQFRNYFVTTPELTRSTTHSEFLTAPIPGVRGSADPKTDAQRAQRHSEDHANAAEALARITALENASSKDRTRINVQRCIELFGRHNTDGFLRPKPESTAHLPRRNLMAERGEVLSVSVGPGGKKITEITVAPEETAAEGMEDGVVADLEGEDQDQSSTAADDNAATPTLAQDAISAQGPPTPPPPTTTLSLSPPSTTTSHRPRAGPDTGSSEVQIAILTSRIHTLADALASPRGRNDKTNKRNLRLVVHKRQKLLQYLRRKERGGERWERCVGMLGLGEASWRGEITL